MTTVDLPLWAGRITTDSSFLRLRSAWDSSGVMLVGGRFLFCRIPTMYAFTSGNVTTSAVAENMQQIQDMPSTGVRQKSLTHTHTGNSDVSWNPGIFSSKPTLSTRSKANYHKPITSLYLAILSTLKRAQPRSCAHGQHLVRMRNS